MSAELEIERAKRVEAEEAARQAMTKAATAQAGREAADNAVHIAVRDATAERAHREAAEQAAQAAAVRLAAEQAKRQAAERAAQEAVSQAAAEKASREAAEEALHTASVRSASDRSERDQAVKSARDFAASASAEKMAREAAEKMAQESNSQAIVERNARHAAEVAASEAKAKAGVPAAATGPEAVKQAPPTSLSTVTPPAAAATATGAKAGLPSWVIPSIIFALALALWFVISNSWTPWESSGSVRTDDAFIRTDVAPLSTKAAGIVRRTLVNDYDQVKAGQILVELKGDEYQARVDQAQAALRQAEIKLSDMKQRKEQQDAKVSEAASTLENSRTSVLQAEDSIAAAQATIEEAQAGIDAARAAVLQSQAAARAASADVTRSGLERARQEALLADESATKEKVEEVVNESDRTMANLEALTAAHSKAKAELAARKALLSKAKRQLSTDQSERQKTRLLVQGRNDELTMQKKQRELLDGEEKQLASEVVSKKAGLVAANVDLDYTVVRAPHDGIVGELKVKPGQLVSAGTQVVTVISAKPWVIANYRETQLGKVKEGDLAAIDIDALPGLHLKGHVEHIAPASGAQFSLLPPDNASGNFTKITQRIPVKISLDEDATRLSGVRPGMSVTVTIRPESKP